MNFVISPANPLQKSSKLYGGKTNESNDLEQHKYLQVYEAR